MPRIATEVRVFWDDTSDPSNPGWLCRYRLADGQEMDEPITTWDGMTATDHDLCVRALDAMMRHNHACRIADIEICRA